MTEFNLEARWVPFAECVPEPENTVLARKIGGNITGAIRYGDNDDRWDDPTWVFNGGFYMHAEDLEGWEWLEVEDKWGEV